MDNNNNQVRMILTFSGRSTDVDPKDYQGIYGSIEHRVRIDSVANV